jgi:hypothetical protein
MKIIHYGKVLAGRLKDCSGDSGYDTGRQITALRAGLK